MDSVAFVDVQGFALGGGGFVVKELAIAGCRDLSLRTFLFKPPEDVGTLPHRFRRRTDWFTERLNGLEWSSGTEAYEDLDKILESCLDDEATLVYVKTPYLGTSANPLW
ncbi:hypothetical protein Zmor_011481 [Zophobas morio]|uniref:Uncharacterized protein n=1 Tax=Zophobas morio TaxID=2755281 RepID=A0AA38ML71_9CUCU|nr:hypothetical protein Zmor_011481 [Zophobas morio]